MPAANIAVANEVPPLDLISMDAYLINHRVLMFQRDLPGLVSGASNPMNQVALFMGAFATEAQEARRISQYKQTVENQPNRPAERWKSMFTTLLKLCEVGYQSLIPQMYIAIAKGSNY